MKTLILNTFKSVILVLIAAGFVTVQGQSVIQTLKENPETTSFARSLENSNISAQLNGNGPYTLFAPSNSAFAQLSASQKTNTLLLNHIFTGMATERSLRAMSDITCLSGKTITVQNQRNQLSVNDHVVITSNIRASNGVIHVIDGVIQ